MRRTRVLDPELAASLTAEARTLVSYLFVADLEPPSRAEIAALTPDELKAHTERAVQDARMPVGQKRLAERALDLLDQADELHGMPNPGRDPAEHES